MHLIDGCQVSVHVAREATPTRHFLSSSRHLREKKTEREREREREREVSIIFVCVCVLSDVDLSQSFSVGAHISEDNKNVFLALIGHELCRGEGKAGGDDTLNPEEEIINVDESFMGSTIYIRWVIGNVQE